MDGYTPKAIPAKIRITEIAHQNNVVDNIEERARSAVIKGDSISKRVNTPAAAVVKPRRVKIRLMVAISASKESIYRIV